MDELEADSDQKGGGMSEALLRIDGQVEWRFWFDMPGDQWLAVCPALNLNAYGATCEDMVECMHAATQMLWDDLLKENDFNRFLRERGWTAVAVRGAPLETPAAQRVDLPYTMRKGVGEEIHA